MHYIIATHGNLAKGFESAMKLIIGEKENIHVISAYIDDLKLEEQVDQVFNKIPLTDELVVFTDIFGGSVNTEFMKRLTQRNFHLISGVNLALIISVIIELQEGFTVSQLKEKIEQCKEMIKYCNDETNDAEIDDDF